MTIASKLIELGDAVESIRTAIVTKGAALPTGSPLTAFPAAVESISGGGEGWVRPSHWPDLTESPDVFSGLVRVPKPQNASAEGFPVAFFLVGSSSALVDWGDGSVPEVFANSTASHTYNWFSLPGEEDEVGYKYVVVNSLRQSAVNPGYNFAIGRGSAGWVDIWLPHTTGASHSFYSSTVKYNIQRIRSSGPLTSLGANLFREMDSLRVVDLAGTSPSTMDGWFRSCRSLERIDNLNTANTTNMNYAFGSCQSMKDFSWVSFAAVTTASQAFYNCTSLQQIVINAPNCTSVASILESCSSLISAEVITPNATSASGAIRGCPSLVYLKFHALPKPSYRFNAVENNPSLSWYDDLSVSTTSITLAGSNLNAAALNKVFTDLGTAASSASINVTGTPGATTCDRTIATAKGWTVTG